MKPTLLAAVAALLTLSGSVAAQEITPNGGYTPAPQAGTVIMPATYTVPQTMPQSVTYSQPGMMTSGMTSGTTQFFPSSMPGSTVLNGTTRVVTNAGTTVVGGTRRVIRRGLGIFRR